MSLLSVLPVHTLLPVLRPVHAAFSKVNAVARPLGNTGLFAALVWCFKPLARGLLQMGLALVSSKPAVSAQSTRRTALNVMMLNRMAAELETQQPQLAAELRLLAAQG